MVYSRLKVNFYGEAIWDKPNSEWPNYQDIRADKNAILNDLDRLSQTALGLNLLNKAAKADSLRFVGLSDDDALQYGPAIALTATLGVAHSIEAVQINYAKAGEVYWFNATGNLVRGLTSLVIAHELAHIVYETWDPNYDGAARRKTTEAEMNAADFDFDGPQVRAQNVIARQMGQPDQVRVSYTGAVYGADDLKKFKLGVSYTNGATVDVVRRAGDGVNTIDHSARTTKLRDLIFGEGGDDTIDAGAGNDFIYGGAGDDTIKGGSGHDTIYGDDRFDFTIAGEDTIDAGSGNDFVYGGAGVDIIEGGTGNDTIYGDDQFEFKITGDDIINGDSGNDTIIGGAGNDNIQGGDNNDVIYGDYGAAGPDVVSDQFTYNDMINGGSGSDIIYGQQGNDTLIGFTGVDYLYGGDGDDYLDGGTNADWLYSGTGQDNYLYGDSGVDNLIFDNGNGTAEGGIGNDVIDARAASGLYPSKLVKAIWYAGDGLDTIKATYSVDVSTLTYSNIDRILDGIRDPRGVSVLEFKGQSINNFKLVWSASLISTEQGARYVYGGNMKVVDKATGKKGFDLGMVLGRTQAYEPSFNAIYLTFYDLPGIVFDDGSFEDIAEGDDNMTLEIVKPKPAAQSSALAALSVSDPLYSDDDSAAAQAESTDQPLSSGQLAAMSSAQQLVQAMVAFGASSASGESLGQPTLFSAEQPGLIVPSSSYYAA